VTINADSLRPALQAFARDKAPSMTRLQRALEIVYRGRTGGRSIEEITEIVLLAVARAYERRTQNALDSLNRSMGRILDDLAAARRSGGQAAGRPRALRESDLREIGRVLDELDLFEDEVKRRIAAHDEELGKLVQDAVSATDIAALNRAVSRGQQMVQWAEQVLDAWRSGQTLEPLGATPLPVRNPAEARLADQMRRLEQELAAYRAAPGTDAVSAAAATDRLRAEAAAANEHLRSAASAFEAVATGDVVPPNRPLRPGAAPEAVSAAKAAEAVLATLEARPDLILSGSNPAELLDALHFSPLEVVAEGRLREPLARDIPGVGLERYLLSAGAIGELKTRPPGLAARLARLVQGWQRAHLVGPGFGSELFAGLMLAPWGVNQVAQNQGIEALLRSARALGIDVEPTIRAKGRRLAIPLEKGGFDMVDLLSSVHYEIPRKNGPPLTFDITVHPDGSWTATHNVPAGVTGADVRLAGRR